MFASYAQDADLKINDVSAPTSKDEFVHSPEKLCTEIVVSDPTTQTRYLQAYKQEEGNYVCFAVSFLVKGLRAGVV